MVNKYALFGHLLQARGLHGQLIAQLAYPIKALEPIKFVFIQIGHTYVPYQVEEKVLTQTDRAFFKLQGITSKSAAQEIVSKSIWLPSSLLDKILVKRAAQDRVIGYYVTDVKLGKLGVVKRTEEFPMHRCLVVDYQNKELLIPYVSALINNLDHTHQRLATDLPPGFLEAVGLSKGTFL